MKKLFFFAAALTASVSVNAQFAKFSGITTEHWSDPLPYTAGQVLATTDAFVASVAFDDSYRTVKLSNDGYGWWEIDGANINAYADTLGLQGNTNPRNADGGHPAYNSTPPASGAVYQVVAKEEGYLYIFHKASPHKAYMVEENGIPIGYHFGMVTMDVDGYFGEAGVPKVIEYTISGNNEMGQITDGRLIMDAVDYIKQEGDTTIGTRDYTRDGLGVIGIRCHKDSTYWFHADGSKMTALGVAYYPEDKDIYAVNEDGTKVRIYAREKSIPVQPVQVLVEVDSACKDMGTVSISGSFLKGNVVTISATPNKGYHFVEWSDGNREAIRKIRLTQDTTLYATFGEGEYLCGENLYWSYEDHALSIAGSGAMDIETYNDTTWHSIIMDIHTVTLPDQLSVICDEAFIGAKYLSQVTIPVGVTNIGRSAFEDCRSMDSVVFAGNNVLTIGDWAFYNCHNLSQITIPEGVEEIGTAAFYGCTFLSEITIPSTTKKIAQNGFALCSKVETMYVNALVPPTIEAKTFEDVDRTTPVFVPQGTLELYQANKYWSEFFNMAEYDAPTGNLSTSTDKPNAFRKVVRDGQVLIIRRDKVYTILGEQR